MLDYWRVDGTFLGATQPNSDPYPLNQSPKIPPFSRPLFLVDLGHQAQLGQPLALCQIFGLANCDNPKTHGCNPTRSYGFYKIWVVVLNIFYVHPYLGWIFYVHPYLGWNHQLEIMFLFWKPLETWRRLVFVGGFCYGCKWGLTTLNGWIHLGESLPNFLSNEQKAKSPINWMFLNNDTASKHSLLCGLFWDPKSKFLTNHLENSFISSETFVVFNVCFVHVEISYHMTINRKHIYQSLCFLCDFLQKLHVAPLHRPYERQVTRCFV